MKKNFGFTLLESLVALGLVTVVIVLVLNGISNILESYSDIDRKKASAISFLYNQVDCEVTFAKIGGSCATPKLVDIFTVDERKIESVIDGMKIQTTCDGTDLTFQFKAENSKDYKPLTKVPLACNSACFNEQRIVQTISFPRLMPMCNWPYNFATERAAHQAEFWGHKTQKIALAIPAGSRVCELSMRSLTSNIRFDDYVLISFSDYLIAATALTEPILLNNYGLAKNNGLIKIDQTTLKSMYGKKPYGGGYLAETDIYCHEDAEKCVFPRTQTLGPVDISVGKEFFARFSDSPPATPSIEFTVTGDNDVTDCSHTGFVLEMDIKVSPKS